MYIVYEITGWIKTKNPRIRKVQYKINVQKKAYQDAKSCWFELDDYHPDPDDANLLIFLN